MSEVLRRGVFQMVGLVQHKTLVGRECRRILPVVGVASDRDVGGEKMVINNHDVGFCGATPGSKDEAPVEMRALQPCAKIGFGAHFVPHFRRWLIREVGE